MWSTLIIIAAMPARGRAFTQLLGAPLVLMQIRADVIRADVEPESETVIRADPLHQLHRTRQAVRPEGFSRMDLSVCAKIVGSLDLSDFQRSFPVRATGGR
ncbi:hypothetical protein T492DRAFT_226289 [Pavlovales sp. CCMP2436]|nr:hypothetical protein T492DRAFT_226289 [Pavlovales sp. CCMP2436]